jgi:hypothetical protein
MTRSTRPNPTVRSAWRMLAMVAAGSSSCSGMTVTRPARRCDARGLPKRSRIRPRCGGASSSLMWFSLASFVVLLAFQDLQLEQARDEARPDDAAADACHEHAAGEFLVGVEALAHAACPGSLSRPAAQVEDFVDQRIQQAGRQHGREPAADRRTGWSSSVDAMSQSSRNAPANRSVSRDDGDQRLVGDMSNCAEMAVLAA